MVSLYLSLYYIVQTVSVCSECTFAQTLTEIFAYISLNQYETYWEITPDALIY